MRRRWRGGRMFEPIWDAWKHVLLMRPDGRRGLHVYCGPCKNIPRGDMGISPPANQKMLWLSRVLSMQHTSHLLAPKLYNVGGREYSTPYNVPSVKHVCWAHNLYFRFHSLFMQLNTSVRSSAFVGKKCCTTQHEQIVKPSREKVMCSGRK